MIRRVKAGLLARSAGDGMAAAFEGGSRSRAVLAAIVADPAFGPRALSHPATLFSLLAEYLPDVPGETGPLLAAAQVDIPGALRDYVAGGVSRRMATKLAAARLAARTGLPDQACLWAACEFALALGLATAGQLAGLRSDGDATAAGPVEFALAAGTGAELLPAGGPRPRGSRGPGSGRPPGLRSWLAAITGGVVVAAAALGIALLFQPHAGGQRQPHHSGSHRHPAARTAGVRPSTATSRPGSASAHASARSAASPRASIASPPASTASPRASTASPAPAAPASIARAYIADVNERDWLSLWQLGGGNVVLAYQPDPGPLTYPEMVATFRHTVSVVITSLTSAGDTVSMRVSALDSAGVTQYYQLNLVIDGGRVVSGSQYYLGP